MADFSSLPEMLFGAMTAGFLLARVIQKYTGHTRRGVVEAFLYCQAMCWILLPAMEDLLLKGSHDLSLAIACSGALLFWFYRDFQRVAVDPAADLVPAVVLSTTDSAGVIHNVSHGEWLAFRFLLLVWAVCVVLLGLAAYAYVERERLAPLGMDSASAAMACAPPEMARMAECRDNLGRGDVRCAVLSREHCRQELPDDATLRLGAERDVWQKRLEGAGYGALFLWFVSSFGFYALRWAFLGRLRPFWLLKR